MLRLSREHVGTDHALLRIEGRLVAEWVDLVAGECEAARRVGGRVTLDLAGVSYADRRGLAMLRRLDPRVVSVVNATPLLQDQLDETGFQP